MYKIKNDIPIETVAGNAEPTPKGEMARPKISPPAQEILTHLLFNNSQIKIRN
jgi:hypothetical protein